MLLGSLSSASPNGAGPFFSVLSLGVGTWGLSRTIVDYRRGKLASVPTINVIGIIALGPFFAARLRSFSLTAVSMFGRVMKRDFFDPTPEQQIIVLVRTE